MLISSRQTVFVRFNAINNHSFTALISEPQAMKRKRNFSGKYFSRNWTVLLYCVVLCWFGRTNVRICSKKLDTFLVWVRLSAQPNKEFGENVVILNVYFVIFHFSFFPLLTCDLLLFSPFLSNSICHILLILFASICRVFVCCLELNDIAYSSKEYNIFRLQKKW